MAAHTTMRLSPTLDARQSAGGNSPNALRWGQLPLAPARHLASSPQQPASRQRHSLACRADGDGNGGAASTMPHRFSLPVGDNFQTHEIDLSGEFWDASRLLSLTHILWYTACLCTGFHGWGSNLDGCRLGQQIGLCSKAARGKGFSLMPAFGQPTPAWSLAPQVRRILLSRPVAAHCDTATCWSRSLSDTSTAE